MHSINNGDPNEMEILDGDVGEMDELNGDPVGTDIVDGDPSTGTEILDGAIQNCD